MITDISNVVKRLKNISFMQPIFEAVTNSLQANSTKIQIDFIAEPTVFEERTIDLICGAKVTDNGDGFNVKNIESFSTYQTGLKADLGCKGVGRLTWLKVFQKIEVASKFKSQEGCGEVSFTFDFNFKNTLPQDMFGKINYSPEIIPENITSIKFTGMTSRYSEPSDKIRPVADIAQLSSMLQNHLLPNLILKNNNGEPFEIILTIEGTNNKTIINNNSIPKLENKKITIEAEGQGAKVSYDFNLMFQITNDKRGETVNYFCANNRTVCKFEDEDLKILMPEQASSIMLLSSPYLDGKVNDERNGFYDIKPKDQSLYAPLSWEDINRVVEVEIGSEIIKKFPNYAVENTKRLDELIHYNPHLAEFLKAEPIPVGIIDAEITLKRARKKYDKAKEEAQKRFHKALERNKVEDAEFKEAVNRVEHMATLELSKYILYRQSIINALRRLSDNKESVEALLHTLFMPMKTESFGENATDSNVWLFDDKFMTYTYIASDKTYEQISKILTGKVSKEDNKRRPDLFVSFSSDENKKDLNCVIVELKGIGASKEEKNKSITEINNNSGAIRDNFPNIKNIWSYIITEIDNSFALTLERNGYKPLFASKDNSLFYKYNEPTQTHAYAISVKTIIDDANLRNVTFLDLLTGKKKA